MVLELEVIQHFFYLKQIKHLGINLIERNQNEIISCSFSLCLVSENCWPVMYLVLICGYIESLSRMPSMYLDSITRATALWIRFRRAPLLRLPRDRPSPTVIAEETSRLSTLIVVRKRQSPPKLLSTEETRNYKDWILLNKRDQKSMPSKTKRYCTMDLGLGWIF